MAHAAAHAVAALDVAALEAALRSRIDGAVRRAQAETMVIACGYSCREQIAQCTEREGLHLADIARLALSPVRAQGAN